MLLRILVKCLVLGGGLYLLLCLLLWFGQRGLMYFPERAAPGAEALEARALGLRPWVNPAGSLLGWRGGGGVRVLLCHGNAGKALHRSFWLPLLQEAYGTPPLEIILLEYPGYGARPGQPSQEQLVAAAAEALDLLWAERPEPILVLGESLGSGVAALAAAGHPERIQGLLMVTPLPSMTEVARVHYPLFPGFLVRDAYPARDALRGLHLPLALILAERDEVIPMTLGRRLGEGYAGPTQAWVEPGATHNTLRLGRREGLLREALAFLRGSADPRSAKSP